MDAQNSTKTYQVNGVSRPGGHGSIRCNTTTVKADTGSVSDGFRPGPAELLCASLAACLLKNIERFSELLPFDYDVASVTVEAERQDTPPRMVSMAYHIEVATDEPVHRVELLHRNIIKFGTITNTLATACDLTGDLVARPTAESSAVGRSGEPGSFGPGSKDQ
jgi:uncharacterized OsmC-like protein